MKPETTILLLMLTTALTINNFTASSHTFPPSSDTPYTSPSSKLICSPTTYSTNEEEERLTDEFIKSFLRNKKFKHSHKKYDNLKKDS